LLPFIEDRFDLFAEHVYNRRPGANWNNPTVNNAGAASFGEITTSLPARVLLFGGKINF
jgi:hypothetical protein